MQRALTHRSFSADHNERLEFLGDAVLGLAISELLFSRWAQSDEGQMTRMRAHLVREATLHKVAMAAGLNRLVRLSEGEAKGGGATRPSILADALEAVIGATFLDAGFDEAKALVGRLFGELLTTGLTDDWTKDPKTALQEWLQARKMPTPLYRIVATRGQAHAQTFEVECVVAALNLTHRAEGHSRRVAEQAAATAVLQVVLNSPDSAPAATRKKSRKA